MCSMFSKAIDLYSYLGSRGRSTKAGYRVDNVGPKVKVDFAGEGTHSGILRIESGNLPALDKYGTYKWTAALGAENVSKKTDINCMTGNMSDAPGYSDLVDMMKTPTIVCDEGVVSYGFYDAGVHQNDQSYVYVTEPLADWMGDVAPVGDARADLPFHRLVLPGAHDAGMNTVESLDALLEEHKAEFVLAALGAAIGVLGPALGAVVAGLATKFAPRALKNISITQKDTVSRMLDSGTRYFDFRPGLMLKPFRNDDKRYHQHLFVPGMAYVDFLTEVLTWLEAHRTEIVVVSCNTLHFMTDDMKPTPEDLDNDLKTARSKSGVGENDVKVGFKRDLGKSVADLRAAGTRLIFLNQVAGGSETTNAAKYDSYDGSAYATVEPAPILAALKKMNETEQLAKVHSKPKYDYTVLQLQATSTSDIKVDVKASLTFSDASSPLLMTKGRMDAATLPWVRDNLNDRLSNTQLVVLLNDFADNATAQVAKTVSEQRLNVDGFRYSTFEDASRLVFRGSAAIEGSVLRLTPKTQYQTGAAWYESKVTVTDGFESAFSFRIDPAGFPADGLAFVVQDHAGNALGDDGGSMGYAGIPKSIAIEFDTFDNNGPIEDLPADHVAVMTRGLEPNSPNHDKGVLGVKGGLTFKDNELHHVVVRYRDGVLTMTFDGNEVLTAQVDLATTIGLSDGKAWVGLTAGTGTGCETHDIESWSFES